MGGRNDLSTDLDLDDSAKSLSKELYTVFPDLKDIPITHTWTGKLGITFDLMPHIGKTNGIYYAFWVWWPWSIHSNLPRYRKKV
ncbi:MAG: hypothetical protein CM1200mP1_12710 [Candidatus Neomarinimicrobiota bacterium]|nr:MAG: hypothetical protein CM1200mP1_12710 [Candidatus Neomarinimicrobiota bacterium]